MRARRGFTLVEVMVALGVLAVGIGGVLAMFAAAASTHRRALNETITAIIADSVLAEQRARFNRNRWSEPMPLAKEPAAGYDLYSYSVHPTTLAREPETGRTVHLYLEIEVHYQRRGRGRSKVFRTVLFRE